jgi:hypothetical protein
VYFKPRFYSDRPDFVIIKKNSGVILVDCPDFDFDLDIKHFPVDKNNDTPLKEDNNPLLFGKIDNIRYNLIDSGIGIASSKYVHNKNNIFFSIHNLVFYNNSFWEYDYKIKKIVKAALYLFLERHNFFNKSSRISDKLYENFMEFLTPKILPSELMQNNIVLDKTQKDLITSKPEYRKIRGLAGCGKTLVMLLRAINAVKRTDKSAVLILCFNITLVNNLIFRLKQLLRDKDIGLLLKIEINNYHAFFKSQANKYNLKKELGMFESQNFFSTIENNSKYSTILIDEVQDYKEEWLKILQKNFLIEKGEFVVFADEKQAMYNRGLDIDNMPKIPGMSWKWMTLTKSYRLSSLDSIRTQLYDLYLDFQSRYLGDYYKDQKEDQPELVSESSIIEYFGEGRKLNSLILDKIINTINTIGMLNVVTAIITEENLTAGRICSYLDQNNIKNVSTTLSDKEIKAIFNREYKRKPSKDEIKCIYRNEDDNSFNDFRDIFSKFKRAKKLNFTIVPDHIRVSTIHSYKGFEAENVFLLIENDDIKPEVLYTAITRSSKNLFIYDLTEGKNYKSFFEKYDTKNKALEI